MSAQLLTTLTPERLRQGYESGLWRDETLYARAIAQAADLRAAGLRAGNRVAVWLPSRVETLVALLACSRDRYVCCPSLHRDHTTGEVLELLTRMRAAALIAEEGYGADAARRDIFAEASGLRRVHRLPRLSDAATKAWEGPALNAAPDAPPVSAPDGVLDLAFTSGTTGQPKGVMHSDNTVLANARAIIADWSLTDSDVICTLSPLSHNLGFGCIVMACEAGCELVLPDLPRGASLLDRVVETGTTFLVGVPTHAIGLLSEVKRRGGRGAAARLPRLWRRAPSSRNSWRTASPRSPATA